MIWERLQPLVFKIPNEDLWRQIGDQFSKKLQFPRCIGCIDGKLVTMDVSLYF